MDPDVAPHMQTPALGDHHSHSQRGIQRAAQPGGIIDCDEPVAALALLRLVRTLELDEVSLDRGLFTQFQATAGDVEIDISLPDLPVILSTQRLADRQRPGETT